MRLFLSLSLSVSGCKICRITFRRAMAANNKPTFSTVRRKNIHFLNALCVWKYLVSLDFPFSLFSCDCLSSVSNQTGKETNGTGSIVARLLVKSTSDCRRLVNINKRYFSSEEPPEKLVFSSVGDRTVVVAGDQSAEDYLCIKTYSSTGEKSYACDVCSSGREICGC